MSVSDRIGHYRLESEFSTAGGGTCQWAKAYDERASEYVFLKKFLSPTYPADDGPGSEKVKAKKREKCLRFERHQRELTKSLGKVAARGGTLAVQIAIFKHRYHYYKVTEWVEGIGYDPAEVARLSNFARYGILASAAKGVHTVHQAGIVHGDLKPSNIMIKMHHSLGRPTATLIDFDSSYMSAKPPLAEDLVGDFPYYSPEMLGYVKGLAGACASDLSTKSDVFAFGLIVHQYLAGDIPVIDRERFGTVAEAVRDGRASEFSTSLCHTTRSLIGSMLALDPTERPTMYQVMSELGALAKTESPVALSSPAMDVAVAGVLRGSLKSSSKPASAESAKGILRGAGASAAPEDSSHDAGGGKLRGKGIRS